MSLLSKKEFAKKCGISTSQLSVYIGREKVITSGKKIDDTLAENMEFMNHRQEKGDVKEVEVIIKPPPKTIKEKKEFSDKVAQARLREADRRTALNSKSKELEIEKMQQEIEILRAKREKLQAFLIPTDVVKTIFAQHTKSIVVSFQQGGENLLIEISKKKS